MRSALLLMLLLLAASVQAADFSEYPRPFIVSGDFDASIVVDDNAPSAHVLAATEIATRLQAQSGQQVSAVLVSETKNPLDRNSILIGNACDNKYVAVVLEADECADAVPATGRLLLKEWGGRAVLIVDGKTADDVRRAARVLALSERYALEGSEHYVTGTLDNPVVTVQLPERFIAEQETCSSDDECSANEFCSAQGCITVECPEGFSAVNHGCVSDEVAAAAASSDANEKQQEQATQNKTTQQPVIEQPQVISFVDRIVDWLLGIFS